MKTSEACLSAIKQFEGFRARAYHDLVGVLTIGYGRTLNVKLGDVTTESAEDAWLRHFVAELEGTLAQWVHEPLTQGQFDALIDFEFNLGRGKLEHSTLLAKLNAGDYDGAALEFPRWVKAGDKTIASLLTRRLTEQSWYVDHRLSVITPRAA